MLDHRHIAISAELQRTRQFVLCATARERYELLLKRCPGIVEHLALQDFASFLCITPNYLSTIRKSITFESKK